MGAYMSLTMGAYLSKPVTEKVSKDEESDRLSYGASSMQGWRVSQEDSHNCIIDFDTDSSFFAVYDGHGGAEVANYCSANLPDCLRSMADYKKGNLGKALEDAFLEFDSSLTKPEVIQELKQIAGLPESDDESVEDARMLQEEASLPLDEVLARYETTAIKKVAPHVTDYGKPKSPMLRGKKSIVSGDHNGPASLSEDTKVKDSSGSELPVVNGEVDAEVKGPLDLNSDEKSSSLTDSDNNESEKTNKKTKESSSESEKCSSAAEQSSLTDSDNNESEKTNKKAKESSSESEKCSSAAEQSSCKHTKDVSKSDSAQTESTSSASDKDNTEGQKDNPKTVKDCMEDQKESSKSDLIEPGCSSTVESRKKNKVKGSSKVSELSSSDEDESDDDDEEYSSEQDSSAEDVPEGENKGDAKDDEEEDEDDSEDEEESDDSEDDEDDKTDMCGMMHNSEEEPGTDSGCTAVVAVLKGNQLYVANAGDSRCVVSRNGEAINLSFDHKPEDELESQRIEKAGGKVSSDGRVNGGLNLSRAMGDHAYKRNETLSAKEQMITALPDIQTLVIDPKEDKFMVLACDGIWNHMSSQDVVDFVNERITKAEKLSSICEELFDHCLAPDILGDGTGCDNMTAIIIKFHNLKQGSKRKNASEDSSQEDTLNSKISKVEESTE